MRIVTKRNAPKALKDLHPLAKRRRHLDLTQQAAADLGHMPCVVVVLLENEAKLEEYRQRYIAALEQAEQGIQAA